MLTMSVENIHSYLTNGVSKKLIRRNVRRRIYVKHSSDQAESCVSEKDPI